MLIFEKSPWLIPLGIILGAVYSFILYRKKNPWGSRVSIILSIVRFFLVFMLFLLLLEPLSRRLNRIHEFPTVIIAIDNSLSLSEVLDSTAIVQFKKSIDELAGQLRQQDIAVEFLDAEGKRHDDIDNMSYNVPKTDLTALLNDIENAGEGKNIPCVILASDGIYNTGSSPVYRNFRHPLIAIGLGDTLEKNDISVRAIFHNKIVYQGNKFSLVAEIFNKGYASRSTQVELLRNGVPVETKTLNFPEQRSLQQVTFILNAERPGIQRFTIQVRPLPGEQTHANNRRESFLEVIEAKEKILLLAHSPHPDIKAIKSAIESNENYELSTLSPDIGQFAPDKYSLIIYHQLPDARGSFNDLIRNNRLSELPSIYIVGSKTNLRALSDRIGWLRINSISARSDNAFPIINQAFNGFTFSQEEAEAIGDFPPLSVPFGEYSISEAAGIALFQKVEGIVTSRPLLAFGAEGDKKTMVLLGEGIWRWRLNEYLLKNDHTSFNSIFLKTVQYAASREDRRKFRVYPVKNEFPDNESVEFETEVYNDIYERIFGHEVSLTVTPENGTRMDYTFVTSETNSRFGIGSIEPGVYHFSAGSLIDGINYNSAGVFAVRHLQIESVNLTADFGLLRRLAEKSAGQFILPGQIETIPSLPALRDARPVIYSSENISSLINAKWIFIILLLLASSEWITRKYLGGY